MKLELKARSYGSGGVKSSAIGSCSGLSTHTSLDMVGEWPKDVKMMKTARLMPLLALSLLTACDADQGATERGWRMRNQQQVVLARLENLFC